jgi:hypothetical protein
MAYITDDEREQLRRLREAQDRRAMELGVITLQWAAQLRQTEVETLRAEANQRKAGEAMLRRHGFDPDAEDLTINLDTGEILRLVNGAWAPTV